MRTIGIIAEYNPFHSGHRHHAEVCRQTFGPDCAIVCAMSGNWVQRGDAAITDKWTRAAQALAGGADLILELPTLWAVSSAETFAQGGTEVLSASGVVDVLSFGSEAGSVRPLAQAAACLDTPAWKAALRVFLDQGLSFPAARQKAAERLLGDEAACLKFPNNNLGVEYLRAMARLSHPMEPHTIPRLGAAHDAHSVLTEKYASASYLRQQILDRSPEPLAPYLTTENEARLRRDPAQLSFCTRGVLARLRSLSPEALEALPDSGEGLSHRLAQAAQTACTLDDLYTQVKSKRYTHARIRRMVLWAFLGLSEADRPDHVPYLRVLGFSPKGQTLLRRMKTSARCPVIIKPASAAKLPDEARRVFDLEARCTALYDLCRKEFGVLPGKNEYTQSPVRLSFR